MSYDYREAMLEDVLDYLRDNYNAQDVENYEDLKESLNDDLWVKDSVTGNGSGSYTFCSATAREYLAGNEEIFEEAAKTFCIEAKTMAEHLFDYEWLDVTIRCYLLNEIVNKAVDQWVKENEEKM